MQPDPPDRQSREPRPPGIPLSFLIESAHCPERTFTVFNIIAKATGHPVAVTAHQYGSNYICLYFENQKDVDSTRKKFPKVQALLMHRLQDLATSNGATPISTARNEFRDSEDVRAPKDLRISNSEYRGPEDVRNPDDVRNTDSETWDSEDSINPEDVRTPEVVKSPDLETRDSDDVKAPCTSDTGDSEIGTTTNFEAQDPKDIRTPEDVKSPDAENRDSDDQNRNNIYHEQSGLSRILCAYGSDDDEPMEIEESSVASQPSNAEQSSKTGQFNDEQFTGTEQSASPAQLHAEQLSPSEKSISHEQSGSPEQSQPFDHQKKDAMKERLKELHYMQPEDVDHDSEHNRKFRTIHNASEGVVQNLLILNPQTLNSCAPEALNHTSEAQNPHVENSGPPKRIDDSSVSVAKNLELLKPDDVIGAPETQNRRSQNSDNVDDDQETPESFPEDVTQNPSHQNLQNHNSEILNDPNNYDWSSDYESDSELQNTRIRDPNTNADGSGPSTSGPPIQWHQDSDSEPRSRQNPESSNLQKVPRSLLRLLDYNLAPHRTLAPSNFRQAPPTFKNKLRLQGPTDYREPTLREFYEEERPRPFLEAPPTFDRNLKSVDVISEVFQKSLLMLKPEDVTKEAIITWQKNTPSTKNIYIISYGKYAIPMMRAAEAQLEGKVSNIWLIVPDDNEATQEALKTKDWSVILPGPKDPRYPNETSVNSTKSFLEFLTEHDSKDALFLFLASHGAENYLCAPEATVGLEKKLEMLRVLEQKGADVNEISVVRRRMSKIKGGRLAEYLKLSDYQSFVMTDMHRGPVDYAFIGPGEICDRNTDDAEITQIFKDRGIRMESLPLAIVKGTDVPYNASDKNQVIASNLTTLQFISKSLKNLGFLTEIILRALTGDPREIGCKFSDLIISENGDLLDIEIPTSFRRLAFVFGGRTTSKKSKNQEHRCLEMTLALLNSLGSRKFQKSGGRGRAKFKFPKFTFLCAPTSGGFGAKISDFDLRSPTEAPNPSQYLRTGRVLDFWRLYRNGANVIGNTPGLVDVHDVTILILEADKDSEDVGEQEEVRRRRKRPHEVEEEYDLLVEVGTFDASEDVRAPDEMVDEMAEPGESEAFKRCSNCGRTYKDHVNVVGGDRGLECTLCFRYFMKHKKLRPIEHPESSVSEQPDNELSNNVQEVDATLLEDDNRRPLEDIEDLDDIPTGAEANHNFMPPKLPKKYQNQSEDLPLYLRSCRKCGGRTTGTNWYRLPNGGWQCQKCYMIDWKEAKRREKRDVEDRDDVEDTPGGFKRPQMLKRPRVDTEEEDGNDSGESDVSEWTPSGGGFKTPKTPRKRRIANAHADEEDESSGDSDGSGESKVSDWTPGYVRRPRKKRKKNHSKLFTPKRKPNPNAEQKQCHNCGALFCYQGYRRNGNPECATCYQYFRKNGTPRPPRLHGNKKGGRPANIRPGNQNSDNAEQSDQGS